MFTYRGNDSICRNLFLLCCLHNAASSRCVEIAQLHHSADEPAAFQLHRCQELHEFHSVINCHDKFFLIRRHIPLRSSVYKISVLHAFRPFYGSGCVHRCISSADDDYVLSDIKISVLRLEVRQELQSVHRLSLLQLQHARLRRACRHDNGCVVRIFQHADVADL